jgi:phosphoserine phosphatase RsbU/P
MDFDLLEALGAPQVSEKILIVDSARTPLKTLEITLKNEGFELLHVATGAEAIEFLKNQDISILICNQNIIDIPSVEIFKQANRLRPQAIRIAFPGSEDGESLVELVNKGKIHQFIDGAWNEKGLLKTIENSLDKLQLARENLRLQLLNEVQHGQLESNHKNLQKELKLGGKIHSLLLLGKIPPGIEGLNVEVFSAPSKEIDGDFFDIYHLKADLIDVVLGDVMGKGLPAALVGTAVKSQLTRFAVPISEINIFNKNTGWKHDILEPEEIMQNVHAAMAKPLIELEYFVTLIYGRFNLNTGIFTYIDCGATKPLHYRWDEKKCVSLAGENFPLGFVENHTYVATHVPFNVGDLFIFYSDGVTEARDFDDHLFGSERLIKLINKYADKEPAEIIEKIRQGVDAFTSKETLDDDLTLMIAKVTPTPQSAKRTYRGKFASDLDQLQAARDFIHRICAEIPGEHAEFDLKIILAIDEIFCNIIEHGYQGERKGEILIQVESSHNTLFIDVMDKGNPYDPTIIPNPSLSGDQFGGFGMYIVKEVADTVTYLRKGSPNGWNRLRLIKYFKNQKDTYMNISHLLENQILIVTLEGENLDAKEAPHVKQKVVDLIAEHNCSKVILDLHKLNFIDSSGLGSLLSLLRALNGRGGDLKIAGMTKPIRTVFELVCMHKIFEIYNNLDEAKRSFQPEASSTLK